MTTEIWGIPIELTDTVNPDTQMGFSEPTSSLIVENSSEVVSVWEDVGLMREVGTARVYQVDAWQSCAISVNYLHYPRLRMHTILFSY